MRIFIAVFIASIFLSPLFIFEQAFAATPVKKKITAVQQKSKKQQKQKHGILYQRLLKEKMKR